MARLPVVGGDTNEWGAILNEFLSVALNSDGTLKTVNPAINVKEFGAKGDGVTDDTAAIQAAIDAAGTTTATMVLLPPGRYKTTSTLTINSGTHRGITFAGVSNGAILEPVGGITAIKLTGAAGGQEVVTLRDFRLIAQSPTSATVGILIDNDAAGQDEWIIERVSILGNGSLGQFDYLGTGIKTVFGIKGGIVSSVVQYWNRGVEFGPSGANPSNANFVRGSHIRANNTGIYWRADDGFLMGSTLEGNSTNLDVNMNQAGTMTVVGNHFEPSGPGTLTSILAAAGRLVTIGNSFFNASPNRDVVISGTAGWWSLGDLLSSGQTHTGTNVAYVSRSLIPAAAGTVAENFHLLRNDEDLQVLTVAGVVRNIIRLDTENRIGLGDAWETSTSAGAGVNQAVPTNVEGYLRIRIPGFGGGIYKIPFFRDS